MRSQIDTFIAEHPLEIGESTDVDLCVHMNSQNGEGIVGYQYLHGTNAVAGDFQITGTITRLSDGSYGCDLSFTWNDCIDVNPDYLSDRLKGAFADLISGGDAEEFDFHISWNSYSVIDYEGDGSTGWLRRPVEDFTGTDRAQNGV